jgi:hypothetical protein
LIDIYCNSKISLHFHDDCGIFCEGDRENTNKGNEVVVQQQLNLPSLLSLASATLTLAALDALALSDTLAEAASLISLFLVGQNDLNDHIGLVDLSDLGNDFVDHIGLVGLNDLVCFINHNGLGLIFPLGCTGPNGFIGVFGLVGHICINSLMDHNCIVGLIGFADHTGLDGLIGLVGHDCIVSFIGSFVGFVGLGLVSLGGLISNISLVCFIGLGLVGFIGLGLVSRLIGLIGLISLGLVGIISLVGLSTHRPFCERLAAAVIEATKISRRLKLAATHGVATLQLSTTRIANAASTYYFTASLLCVHSLVREKMWWWLALAKKKMWWWIASFGESYHGDALQYAKQKFSARLLQMTKYCVMRECENILRGYLYVFDLAFSHHDGIHGF